MLRRGWRARMAPVVPLAAVERPRRNRWLRLPTFGGTFLRHHRRHARDIPEAAVPIPAAWAPEMESDEEDDEDDDDFMRVPGPGEDWANFLLRDFFRPMEIPELPGTIRNEVLNRRRVILFELVPEGQPRPFQGGAGEPAAARRSNSARKYNCSAQCSRAARRRITTQATS